MTTKSQLMRRVIAGELVEIFDHSHFGQFDITATRHIVTCLVHIEPREVLFSDMRRQGAPRQAGDAVLKWLRENREIDDARVAELTDAQIEEPAIHMIVDGFHYPIDGMHRIFARYRRGLPGYRYYVLPMAAVPRPLFGGCDVPWGQKDVVPGVGAVVRSKI